MSTVFAASSGFGRISSYVGCNPLIAVSRHLWCSVSIRRRLRLSKGAVRQAALTITALSAIALIFARVKPKRCPVHGRFRKG